MTRANQWTPDEEAWLRAVYPDRHNAEIATMHAEAFPETPRTAKAIASRAKVLGLRKAEGFVRYPATFWTDERAAWFRSFVPGHTESEISAEHERVFGTPLSEAQIGNAKTKFGVRSGTHGGRFEKGMAAWNKGKCQAEYMSADAIERTKATRFKKGEVRGAALARDQPVGSERVNRDGYIEVKVAEGLQSRPNSNFRMKHHVAYEQAHGPIPSGCNVVFADHDKRNFDPSNLVAVPRDLWAVIGKRGLKYHDRESLEATMNLARLCRAVHSASCRPRECGACGAEFSPRYPHQRTCDACLDAGRRARRAERRFTQKGEGECAVCGARFVKRRRNQRRCDSCIADMPTASVAEQRARML